VRPEVVVRSVESNGAVNLKQGLPNLICFFDVAVLHCANPSLCLPEGSGESLVPHQPLSAVFASFVRGFPVIGLFPRKLERKRSLPVGSSRATMAAIPLAQQVGPPNVNGLSALRKEIHARLRHRAGQLSVRQWRTSQQLFEFRSKWEGHGILVLTFTQMPHAASFREQHLKKLAAKRGSFENAVAERQIEFL
jgi:hypothetical protein